MLQHRAALQGCTGPQQVQLMSPLLLLFCPGYVTGPGWLLSQVIRSPQQKVVRAPQKAYPSHGRGACQRTWRGKSQTSPFLGEENLSTPNLQICAHGLTIPHPGAKANSPLLPAGKACPLWSGQHMVLPLPAEHRHELVETGCQKLKGKAGLELAGNKKDRLMLFSPAMFATSNKNK